jgi:hypothetical protein
MRSDHTAAEYSASRSAMPLASSTLGDSDGDSDSLAQNQPRPLARITFCFAWLFGLEPFLMDGTSEQSPPGMDHGL